MKCRKANNTIPLGVADIKRAGTDITIVASEIMVHKSLAAAEKLEKEGISVEVIDPRTLRPLDTETITKSVKKTGRLLIVHEAVKTAGWAGEVMASISESPAWAYLDAPMRRLAGLDTPIPYNPNLEAAAVPQEDDIYREVKAIIKNEY